MRLFLRGWVASFIALLFIAVPTSYTINAQSGPTSIYLPTLSDSAPPTENPDDPDNPDDPGNPGDPDDPSEPGEPGDPSDPGDPGDPDNPNPPDEPGEPEDNSGLTEDDITRLEKARVVVPSPITKEAPPELPDNSVAAADVDGDGVPNEKDICPFQPNAPADGKQYVICGDELNRQVNDFVFLKSRIFAPTQGVDPAIAESQQGDRVHLLLHVIPAESGEVLPTERRKALASQEITVLNYLPHNTYFISMPRDFKLMQQLVAVPYVQGLSALLPQDKISPEVRQQGPIFGTNDDGTYSFEVEFFSDVPRKEAEAWLSSAKISYEHRYEQTYQITVNSWRDMQKVVIQDIVYWIDDLPEPVRPRTLNAQALINGQIVQNTLGLRGVGRTVSMVEPYLPSPIDHPEMINRITYGNEPILEAIKPLYLPFFGGETHPGNVAVIMIGNGSVFPERQGLLPGASLVAYSVIGLTTRAQHFGVAQDARDNFDALYSNHSWGPTNCGKIGEYTKRGKFFDRAVYDVGIPIIYASGNTRGPTGDFATDTPFATCAPNLYSLPHPVAKNDLSIGNWDITANSIATTSASGPAADERLKPDVIAPGTGTNTTGISETETITGFVPIASTFGGTSAAAPVSSGVVGWLMESFLLQGETLDSIPPARIKAILVHTAQDQGPPNPDYLHGYGLIQADQALRMAEEFDEWGREGTLDGDTSQQSFQFDINSPMPFFKATLAWDDEEGEQTSTLALKNDLDLTLVSPSGETFFPWDLPLTPGATVDPGAVPCTDPSCQDRLNNVEQIVVTPDAGDDYLASGTWTINVTLNRLVSDEQDFSLILTPPCPVILNSSVTLISDLACAPTSFNATAVIIEADDVTLDCDAFMIDGPGPNNLSGLDSIGIQINGDNATVQNCFIQEFDVGIQAGSESALPSAAQLLNNDLRRMRLAAISLHGFNHTVQGNSIRQMSSADGSGILVDGNQMTLIDNGFGQARMGGAVSNNIAIDVLEGSANGSIVQNGLGGLWRIGIRLRSDSTSTAAAVSNFSVSQNNFEGIRQVPIRLVGRVTNSDVTSNTITNYGAGFGAIEVIANSARVEALEILVSGNEINASTSLDQAGIRLLLPFGVEVTGNQLRNVTTGIVVQEAQRAYIHHNTMDVTPGNSFRIETGIESTDSRGLEINGVLHHINENTISQALIGIDVDQSEPTVIRGNELTVETMGIRVVGNGFAVTVAQNEIGTLLGGINIDNAPGDVAESTVSQNKITTTATGTTGGIFVQNSTDVTISGNVLADFASGIGLNNSPNAHVVENEISAATTSAIFLTEDEDSIVEGNVILENESVGVAYLTGTGGLIQENTMESAGAGIGVQLGTDATPCIERVDEVDVLDNNITNHAKNVLPLCDVGDYTDSGN